MGEIMGRGLKVTQISKDPKIRISERVTTVLQGKMCFLERQMKVFDGDERMLKIWVAAESATFEHFLAHFDSATHDFNSATVKRYH